MRMRYRTPLATAACLSALAAATLAGCGAADDGGGSAKVSPSSAAQTRLTIEVRSTPQGSATTWTLTCDPAGGTHPKADAACQALEKATDPFKPVPKDALCTQIHGGDQVATVTGTWRGASVNARFNRLNGCEIQRWEEVAALFAG